MATGLTFDSLVTDLQRYVQRGNATADASAFAEIPRTINRTEVGLARTLKIQGDQQTVVSAMDPTAQGVVAKPVDWLDTISINVGTGTSYNTTKVLFPRSYEYGLMYWPDRTETGEPSYYADYDLDHWWFFGCPDLPYPFEALYHSSPPLLSADNQTNWLTEHMPDVMLNACVVAMGLFVGWKADKLASFEKERDAGLGTVNAQDIMKIVDRATTRRSA